MDHFGWVNGIGYLASLLVLYPAPAERGALVSLDEVVLGLRPGSI